MARIRATDTRLQIRIRHHAMRFLSLVLFITSLAGFNNEKQPDGRVIGAGFLCATILVLLATRAVTLDLDRAADRFSIRYGGILFGVPKKTIERPLHDLKFASTDMRSGTGLTNTTHGRSSRVVFVFASEERVPVTRFWSGGDMAEHHAIERAVNHFLEHRK